MPPDEITRAIRSADTASPEALRAGVAEANVLAPTIFAAAEKLCRGVYLLPEDNNLLFHGLHILAAARHPDLLQHVLAMVRLPEPELDQIFPDYASISLARLLISCWQGDDGLLFDLTEHADLVLDAKWALFDVLARLTFDGRIPRERTLAFLERLERDRLMDDEDPAWWGWEDAVTKLGARELEPALHRVWAKAFNANRQEQDRTESLDELNRAATDPADAEIFAKSKLKAIDDPVEAVAWVAQRDAALAAWRAEQQSETGPVRDDDPAEAVRLTAAQRQWLRGFLISTQVPQSTMTFEMLDGFLTALVIGPALVKPSEYLPEIWGTDNGEGPIWDSQEQVQYFLDLLMRHWNAIVARRTADAPHDPDVEQFGEAEPGRPWAEGFFAGVNLRRDNWDPIFKDRALAPTVLAVLALVEDAAKFFADPVTPELREEILEQLPDILQQIAAFWRNEPELFSGREPIRSSKVRRNAPCPCGSGKKFKKCCGSIAVPTLG